MRKLFAISICSLLLCGCIEPFRGSFIQFTMENVDTPCEVMAKAGTRALEAIAAGETPDPYYAALEQYEKTFCTPLAIGGDSVASALKKEMDDRFTLHYELWATVNQSAAVFLKAFTVQRILFPDEQKKLDGKVRLNNGKVFKIATDKTWEEMTDDERESANFRMGRATDSLAITTFSTSMFESETERIFHEDFYFGNYRQLTLAHNGTYLGAVKGQHPYGQSTISGASIRVDADLEGLDSLWITVESRAPDRADLTPSDWIYVAGPVSEVARGTLNVEATSTWDSAVKSSFGVFAQLDEEEYF